MCAAAPVVADAYVQVPISGGDLPALVASAILDHRLVGTGNLVANLAEAGPDLPAARHGDCGSFAAIFAANDPQSAKRRQRRIGKP